MKRPSFNDYIKYVKKCERIKSAIAQEEKNLNELTQLEDWLIEQLKETTKEIQERMCEHEHLHKFLRQTIKKGI